MLYIEEYLIILYLMANEKNNNIQVNINCFFFIITNLPVNAPSSKLIIRY